MVINPQAFSETRNGRQQTTDGLWLHRGPFMVRGGPVDLPDTARTNLLTNGGFRIWQRGNGPFTLGWTADRWQFGMGAGASFSVSKVQNGAGPSVDPWAAMLEATYTHGSAASSIFQPIMTTDADLRGKTVTFACWIRSTVAATTGLRLVSDGTSAQDMFVSIVQANTWERLIATINVPNNATLVYCQMQMGASCTAYMTDATLMVGSVAADYAPLHPAEDLARCQRYYERFGGGQSPSILGHAAGSEAWGQTVYFKTNKPVSPSLTKIGTWGAVNCSQPVFDQTTGGTCRMYTVASAAGAFECVANGSAFLAIEANP